MKELYAYVSKMITMLVRTDSHKINAKVRPIVVDIRPSDARITLRYQHVKRLTHVHGSVNSPGTSFTTSSCSVHLV